MFRWPQPNVIQQTNTFLVVAIEVNSCRMIEKRVTKWVQYVYTSNNDKSSPIKTIQKTVKIVIV